MRTLLAWLGGLTRPDVIHDLHLYGGPLVVAVALWQISRWEIGALFYGCWLAGLGLWTARQRKP